MTNPTANRAYDMPASTDLVTNLPVDFAIFGDAVDLDISSRGGYTTTATAAGTTTLTVTSNRNLRFTGTSTQNCDMPVANTLTVGAKWKIQNKSTGIVTVRSSGGNTIIAIAAGASYELTCILASGTTAASWDYDWAGATAAPSGSKLVLITRAAFSAVATTSTTFDSVFTSTYKAYKIVIETIISTSAAVDLRFQFRVGGVTQTANNWYGSYFGYNNSGILVEAHIAAASPFPICTLNNNVSHVVAGEIMAYQVGNASELPMIRGNLYSAYNHAPLVVGGDYGAIQADGFILSPSAGNITGTVAVYGLATS